MKRDATQTIWRTVVFAGAMLGAPACSKKNAQTTPANPTPAAADPAPEATNAAATTPSTDPATPAEGEVDDEGRPRGSDEEDEGGGMGRGFVLS